MSEKPDKTDWKAVAQQMGIRMFEAERHLRSIALNHAEPARRAARDAAGKDRGAPLMLWLDHLIFGNGFGMKSPHWDYSFYWLSGRLYTHSSGFGAQLCSNEWRRPPAGTRRALAGREFVVFSTERRWFRVRCSWGMAQQATLESLRELKHDLNEL